MIIMHEYLDTMSASKMPNSEGIPDAVYTVASLL